MDEERLIFHVDMNAFFASVEQRFNPALRGRPIAVCGNPQSRTVVAACSYEAKAFGVKNGMSVHEARALCPGLIPVAGNPDKYVDIAHNIFALFGRMTPQMEVFSIDEAFLDLTRTYHVFGLDPEDAARWIKARIRSAYGLTCSIGIGPNKLIAKLASGLRKPDGLTRVSAAEVPALLRDRPVEALCGIGPRLTERLRDLNIFTCGQLGEAPESLLLAKFGIMGLVMRRMGRGEDASPVAELTAEAAAKSMGHSYTLARDTDSPEEIRGTLLRLSERVARRLRVDGYQGRTVGVTIRYADFSSWSHEHTLSVPTDHGPDIYEAGLRLFARYGEPLRQRVRLIGIGVSQLVRHERQESWLDEEVRAERLDRCLDALADRFGESTVARASAAVPLVTKSHGFLVKSPRRGRGVVLR